jgi:hypothetical protein
VTCCKPIYIAFPSGYAWAHSKFCNAVSEAGHPLAGQKLGPGAMSRAARYPDAEQIEHERRAIADLEDSGCPVHAGYKPWDACPGCAADLEWEFG